MTYRNHDVEKREDQIHSDGVRTRLHPGCFVCSSANEGGLGLEFVEKGEGAVEACFNCETHFEGYSGYVHGGIVSSVLDGAMTNCLFTQGYPALTAELNVRFHHPLMLGKPAIVSAWVEHHTRCYHFLRAEIAQDSLIKARAWAKFLDRP